MGFKPSIVINLPVASLKASEPFYEALGFEKEKRMCSDDTTCMVLSANIAVMLMEKLRFTSFTPTGKSVTDAHTATETLLCFFVEKREDVDPMAELAHERGGKKDPTTLPQMEGWYGRSVEDPDGHVWEVGYMVGGECGMDKMADGVEMNKQGNGCEGGA